MANGYDDLSLRATGFSEASSSSVPMSQMMPVAVRDKRFTKKGIGYRTQQEAAYAGGTATGRRGGTDTSKKPWETAQEATSPQIRPREAVERFGLNEALPPWLQKKGEGDDEEAKEAAVALVRENMGLFPCEDDARIALAVLSQFADGDVLDEIRDAIEKQYGDPSVQPVPEPDWEDDGFGLMGESALQEAPLNADKRDKLDDSDFALPGRKYPIQDPAHARSALARVKQFGKKGEEAKVKAAVKKRYPNMDVS